MPGRGEVARPIRKGAQRLQPRCCDDGYTQAYAFSTQQLVKTRSILDDELLKPEVRAIVVGSQADASKGGGVDPDAAEATAAVKKQALEGRAAGTGDHAVQGALGDANTYERELLELGEADPLHWTAVRDVALADGRGPESGPEAERRRRWLLRRRPRMVAELDLLKVVEGRGAQPGIHGGGAVMEVVRGDTEQAAGAVVGGEDAGHDAGVIIGEIAAVEVERGGAPEVSPPGGEDLGACGLLGWEEGDDVAQYGVGEAADVAHASTVAVLISSSGTTGRWWFLAAVRACLLDWCSFGSGRLHGRYRRRRGRAGLRRFSSPLLPTGSRRLHGCG